MTQALQIGEAQKEIRFHVMVPVYKTEKYLDECVQSVLNQTYPHFSLYLVDDGSPDRCGEICDAWAAKDSRIHVIHKENRGALHSRRIAIRAAGTDGYGLFLDSDDALVPNALEKFAQSIQKNQCDCLVYGIAEYIDGKLGKQLPMLKDAPRLVTDKREMYDLFFCSGDYDAWCKVFQMGLLSHNLDDYAPFYGKVVIGEDRLQSLEIVKKCNSIYFLPDVLYKYRIHADSVMHTQAVLKRYTDFTIYEVERELLERDPVYSGEPFQQYHTSCIFRLAAALVQIAALPIPRAEKIRLYQEIKETSYWKNFLAIGGYDKRKLRKLVPVYEAFRLKQYWLIILITTTYNLLKKQKRTRGVL